MFIWAHATATSAPIRRSTLPPSAAVCFGDYHFDKLLPEIGLGLRYRASDKYPVNIGVDFAFGKRSSAYYFRIGEAF